MGLIKFSVSHLSQLRTSLLLETLIELVASSHLLMPQLGLSTQTLIISGTDMKIKHLQRIIALFLSLKIVPQRLIVVDFYKMEHSGTLSALQKSMPFTNRIKSSSLLHKLKDKQTRLSML